MKKTHCEPHTCFTKMFAMGILLHRTNSGCMHSLFQERVNVTYYKPSKRTAQKAYEWKNIRITFDYSKIRDWETACNRSGQIITEIMSQNQYECKEEDIVTDNHIKVVQGTFQHVANYIQGLLKVIPLEDGYTSPITDHVYKNTDYELTVNINACKGDNCPVIAIAFYEEVEKDFNRPIAGTCVINVKDIPNEVSSADSENNLFYTSLLHEFIHALGFSKQYIEYMHPPENPVPYENKICDFKKQNKFFFILTTPMAHIYALNHYGVEYFYGDTKDANCTSGIELEDGGRKRTEFSHLESRTFLSDIMVDMTQPEGISYRRLTDATLAFLLDTGNYKVNWSMAQPLVWGNPESIDGKPIKDFATGSPQTTFPEGYLGNQANSDNILFDFKGFGKINNSYISKITDMKCDTNDTIPEDIYICDILKFVNPKNLSVIAKDSVFDYNFRKFPKSYCKDGEAALYGNYTKCVKYTCNKFESFTVEIPDYGKLACDNTTIGKSILFKDPQYNSYNITCPNPERFCRTVKLHEMHFVNDPFILNAKQFEKNLSTTARENKMKIYIIVGVVCGVLLLAIIAGVAIFINRKKSDNNDQDIEDIQDNEVPKDTSKPQDTEEPKDNIASQDNEEQQDKEVPQDKEEPIDNEEPQDKEENNEPQESGSEEQVDV